MDCEWSGYREKEDIKQFLKEHPECRAGDTNAIIDAIGFRLLLEDDDEPERPEVNLEAQRRHQERMEEKKRKTQKKKPKVVEEEDDESSPLQITDDSDEETPKKSKKKV